MVVDIMRGGPGLGNIAPSQGDYFQMVKGGGHGDFTQAEYVSSYEAIWTFLRSQKIIP